MSEILTASEKRIVQLEATLPDMDLDTRDLAMGLLRRFRAGRLTGRDWAQIKAMTRRPRKAAVVEPWSLYAISDGSAVKLGMAKDVIKRRDALQTAHPYSIEIVWQLPLSSRSEAAAMERKLHRYCRAHHIRGEWFTTACIPMLAAFKPKGKQR